MIGEILLGAAGSLLATLIEKSFDKEPDNFAKAKIQAKVSEFSCAVMEPLSEYLDTEGIEVCVVDQIIDGITTPIEDLLTEQKTILELGLDTEKIVDHITNNLLSPSTKKLSTSYPSAFSMTLNAFVQLAVNIPPQFKEWETQKFQFQFKQIDDVKNMLAEMYQGMENNSLKNSRNSPLIEKICHHKTSLAALKLTIHGLRKTPVPQADIDQLFIEPHLSELTSDPAEERRRPTVKDTFSDSNKFISTLGSNSNVFISAGAGAGKSTWASWLSSQLISPSHKILAITKQLRRISNFDEAPSLMELVKENVPASFGEQITSAVLNEWSSSGQLVVILDGFDEIAESVRTSAFNWISSLTSAYPGTVVIVTSRPLSSDHGRQFLSQGWRDIRLDPFDRQRIESYIRKFQQYGPEIQTGSPLTEPAQLAHQWQSDPTIGPLTENPLLLSTLLVVHHMDGQLPDDRAQLYDRYIDGMLGLWETRKELVPHHTPLSKAQKKRFLQIIAMNMISEEIDAVDEEQVSLWVNQFLTTENVNGSAKNVLDHLRERSGLLIGPGQYSFAHKSIGEFLVAQACLDGIYRDIKGVRFDRKHLEMNVETDRWNTVVFLWAGLAPILDVQEFINSLLKLKRFSLVGGLLFDRRKYLEKEWLERTFWIFLKEGSKPGAFFTQYSHKYYVEPGHFQNEDDGNILLSSAHSLSSISEDIDEFDLIKALYEMKAFDALDFVEKSHDFGTFDLSSHFHRATRFVSLSKIPIKELKDKQKTYLSFIYFHESKEPINQETCELLLKITEEPYYLEALRVAIAHTICTFLLRKYAENNHSTPRNGMVPVELIPTITPFKIAFSQENNEAPPISTDFLYFVPQGNSWEHTASAPHFPTCCKNAYHYLRKFGDKIDPILLSTIINFANHYDELIKLESFDDEY